AVGPLVAEFGNLDAQAQALDDLGAVVMEREVASVQAMAESVQRFVFWQLVALVPVALLLVVGSIILISRPIAQIDAAIRRLGEGDFQAPVEVQGPRDLQRLGQQLDWMRQRLIDLEAQKTGFMRHMSHELKTPLASLREGTDLLDEQVVGQLSPGQREVAAILKQSTQRLQRLIEDLLAYHSAQFHGMAVNAVPIPLCEVIARAGQEFRLPMASKGIRFQVECPSIVIRADREKLAAILGNLVSNAVKFSPQGGRVRVKVHTDAMQVVIDVIDDGPGVPDDERTKVFEPFFQGRAPYQGPVKGTGLGLAIVKEFVAAHDGSIEIVDRKRPGAQFRVTLPIQFALEDAA
ncbi:MAG: HAMP domain-containing histidine kinase, partial [Burkholderiales bacterium]|nr:HAMP domain-containing histidine kinase [Burkholderiales bacterium]